MSKINIPRDEESKKKAHREKIEAWRKYNDKYKHKYRDDDGNINYPEAVVDKEEYDKFVEAHELMVTDEDVTYATSDPEVIINMLAGLAYIRKVTKHLSEVEKEKIEKVAMRFYKLKNKCSIHKRRAYKSFNNDGTTAEARSVLDTRYDELIEMFGRFFTSQEVHKVISIDWGFDISITAITNFRTRHADKIRERQEEFRRDFSDVRLGIKRSRLDELSYLYTHRKNIYVTSTHRDDSKEMRAILEQIRKEVEGDRLTVDGDIHIQHDIRIQQQINEELLRGISLKSLIIARVAAKLGVNSLVLQNRLVNSYYAKLTGFQRADKDLATDTILYPSQLIYDFDELEKRNSDLQIEDAQIVSDNEPTVTANESVSLSAIKEELMQRLALNRNMNIRTQEKIANSGGKKPSET